MSIASCVLTAVALLANRAILTTVFGSISEDAMKNAEIYFAVSAVTHPFIGLYSACSFLFRCIGNSRISLYVSLVMNVMNVIGNAILIYSFGFVVFGAALSTLISRCFVAIAIMALLCKRNNPLCILAAGSARLNRNAIGKIFKIDIPRGLKTCFLMQDECPL